MNKILKFVVKSSLSLVMAICMVTVNVLAMKDEYRADKEDGMGLAIRVAPGINSDQADGGVWSGDEFIVTDIKDKDGEQWGETTFNGVYGWVRLKYATFIRHLEVPVQHDSNSAFAPGVYRADREDGEGLAIRVNPELNSAKRAGGVWSGDEFIVTSVKDIWGETTFNGVYGWVCLKYATFLRLDPEVERQHQERMRKEQEEAERQRQERIRKEREEAERQRQERMRKEQEEAEKQRQERMRKEQEEAEKAAAADANKKANEEVKTSTSIDDEIARERAELAELERQLQALK